MRFVVLEHTGTQSYKPGVHWDLLCETAQGLRAWECACEPFSLATQTVLELPLHRDIYLDYEGPISGDRGSVRCQTAGLYFVMWDEIDRFEIRIAGVSDHGELRLLRDGSDPLRWRLEWLPK